MSVNNGNDNNVAGAALIFGLALLLFGSLALIKSLAAQRWHTTSGTIITSEVVEGFDTVAEPRIVYRYEVNGHVYTADRITFMWIMYGSRAARVATSYRVGQGVTVYYDPKNPARAVLDPQMPLAAWMIIAMGAMCLGAWRWAKRQGLKAGRSNAA